MCAWSWLDWQHPEVSSRPAVVCPSAQQRVSAACCVGAWRLRPLPHMWSQTVRPPARFLPTEDAETICHTTLPICTQHTIHLCSHVAQCGPDQWEELAGRINCQPAHCALRWHVLQLGRLGSAARTTKVYSEWELCALFLVSSRPRHPQVPDGPGSSHKLLPPS